MRKGWDEGWGGNGEQSGSEAGWCVGAEGSGTGGAVTRVEAMSRVGAGWRGREAKTLNFPGNAGYHV
jgi:hypothetical protein